MTAPHIVWLRRDLRLADQPAFHAAAARGPVIAVYVLDDERPGSRRMGGAARWWLHHSLAALGKRLAGQGSRLILRRGDCVEELCRVARETGAAAVHAIRHYEPWWREAEDQLGEALALQLHDGNYLVPPGSLLTGAGESYRMFTPFRRALQRARPPCEPVPEPRLVAPARWPQSDDLAGWGLLPALPDWAAGLREEWKAGEAAARVRLDAFLDRVDAYDAGRNLPSIEGSSRLSPHLHFGEISPGQVSHAFEGRRGKGAETFRSELAWRDFAQHLVHRFPAYAERSYSRAFDSFPWRTSAEDLAAWQQGRTGYPIVDAGMRQLWASGWMHNRVRMIAASFLVKHLLLDWRQGERWFWDTLVDADYGNNAVNWQWVAGSGADASMFGRIMAPLVQSEKFAAAGYIRRWVPELAHLPDEAIHDPPSLLRPAGYPQKIVGHREARERALEAWRRAKRA